MERCDVCGHVYEKVNCRQVLCGNRDCLKERKLENGKDWRKRHPEYMTAYMATYNSL